MDEDQIDYLKGQDFYEWVHVAKSRKTKVCCLCGNTIPSGTSQRGMRFYGDDGEFPVNWLCADCEISQKDLITKLTTYKS